MSWLVSEFVLIFVRRLMRQSNVFTPFAISKQIKKVIYCFFTLNANTISLDIQWSVLSPLFRDRKPREGNFISLTQFPWLDSGWVANKLTGDFHFSSLTWLLSRGPPIGFHSGTVILFQVHFFGWSFFSEFNNWIHWGRWIWFRMRWY